MSNNSGKIEMVSKQRNIFIITNDADFEFWCKGELGCLYNCYSYIAAELTDKVLSEFKKDTTSFVIVDAVNYNEDKIKKIINLLLFSFENDNKNIIVCVNSYNKELHSLQIKNSFIHTFNFDKKENFLKIIDEIMNTNFTFKKGLLKYTLTDNPIMNDFKISVKKAQYSDLNVILLGESGCGKTYYMEEIVKRSLRKDKKWIRFDANRANKELFDFQLFGSKKGSFTGADRDMDGIIEQLDGGTILIDEIADLSLENQGKLLEVIGENLYYKLGETQPRKINVRVICATNKNIKKLLNEDLFRKDLYNRLNGLLIYVPSLNKHVEDIPGLCNDYFLKRGYTVSKSALITLMNYNWNEKNIRFLFTVLERAVTNTMISPFPDSKIIEESALDFTY